MLDWFLTGTQSQPIRSSAPSLFRTRPAEPLSYLVNLDSSDMKYAPFIDFPTLQSRWSWQLATSLLKPFWLVHMQNLRDIF